MAGECNDPDMMREHERRITEANNKADNAQERINEIIGLIKNFTVVMKESNDNIAKGNINIAELVGEIKALTQEVNHVVKATDKHENDIADIKDNMETKDTVLKLYDQLQASNLEHKKGLDAVMAKMREQDKALEDHKLEPALEVYKAVNSLKKWLIAGIGAIIISVATAIITFIILK